MCTARVKGRKCEHMQVEASQPPLPSHDRRLSPSCLSARASHLLVQLLVPLQQFRAVLAKRHGAVHVLHRRVAAAHRHGGERAVGDRTVSDELAAIGQLRFPLSARASIASRLIN